MRKIVFIAALALAGCMPQAPQQQQQGAATTTTTTTVGTAAPNKGGPEPSASEAVDATRTLDREFMIGRWGDNGDCSKDVVLNADGSFTSYTGGEGQWSLNGATLVMAGKASTLSLQLDMIDHNSLRITNPDGSVGTSQRCG